MNYLLILVSVLSFSVNNAATRIFQLRVRYSKERLPVYQALFCLCAAVFFWAYNGFAAFPPKAILFGTFFGVLFFSASALAAWGYANGSMALTSLITNCSLLIPVFYSVFFRNEPFTVNYIVGLILFLLSLLISSGLIGGKKQNASLLWLSIVMLAFLSNGATAVIQKVFVSSDGGDHLGVFMAFAYFCAGVCFVVRYTVMRAKSEEAEAAYDAKTFGLALLLSIMSGAGSFGGNLLLGILSARVDGALLYPCINGGLCLTVSVFSFLFFKEKPTKTKLLSLLVGIAAIVVLNI